MIKKEGNDNNDKFDGDDDSGLECYWPAAAAAINTIFPILVVPMYPQSTVDDDHDDACDDDHEGVHDYDDNHDYDHDYDLDDYDHDDYDHDRDDELGTRLVLISAFSYQKLFLQNFFCFSRLRLLCSTFPNILQLFLDCLLMLCKYS